MAASYLFTYLDRSKRLRQGIGSTNEINLKQLRNDAAKIMVLWFTLALGSLADYLRY